MSTLNITSFVRVSLLFAGVDERIPADTFMEGAAERSACSEC